MDEGDCADEDDPELSCFCLVSSGKTASRIILHARVWMQRGQLWTEASAGMSPRWCPCPSRPALWHNHLNEVLVHSFSGICASDLNFSERGLLTLALLIAFHGHCLGAFQTWILQLLFTQQRDGNFRRSDISRVLCIRRGCNLRPRLNPMRGTVWLASVWLCGSFPRLKSWMAAAFCYSVSFIKMYWVPDFLTLAYSLQVGLLVLFQVCWAPERIYRLANLLHVRLWEIKLWSSSFVRD